jgi:hypothetical protein
MGKVFSIIGGAIAVVIGLILVIKWLPIVIMGIKFCIVGSLFFGGLMAMVFGFIEIKDAIELKKIEKGKKE